MKTKHSSILFVVALSTLIILTAFITADTKATKLYTILNNDPNCVEIRYTWPELHIIENDEDRTKTTIKISRKGFESLMTKLENTKNWIFNQQRIPIRDTGGEELQWRGIKLPQNPI